VSTHGLGGGRSTAVQGGYSTSGVWPSEGRIGYAVGTLLGTHGLENKLAVEGCHLQRPGITW
jgi:hypothetical protein